MKKPNGREGLPLAASDIEQGPYKVESSHSVYDRFQVRRVKDGKPIGTIGERGSVQALCDELNAAYLAGTKASTSEGDQLSEEDFERMADDGGYEKLPEGYGEGMKLARVDQRLCFMHGIRYARDHGLLSDPRRSKMVEAGKPLLSTSIHETMEAGKRPSKSLMMDWWAWAVGLEGGNHSIKEHALALQEKVRHLTSQLDPKAIGGEDGGGPLSGDGGGSLGAPVAEPTVPCSAVSPAPSSQEDAATPGGAPAHDPTRYGHCSGCADPRSEGTHQMGTIEHPDYPWFPAQGPIDAVPAPKPTFKRTKP